MVLLVNSVLETILNPSGRFKTLQAIAPASYDSDAVVGVWRGEVSFDVMINSCRYRLSCSLDTARSLRESNVMTSLGGIDPRWLIDVDYREQEMLVIDPAGDYYYLDVLLSRCVDGPTLAQELIDCYAKSDFATFDNLRAQYARLLTAFVDNSEGELRLSPDDIKVDCSGGLKVTSYVDCRRSYGRHLSYALLFVLMRSGLLSRLPFGFMGGFVPHILGRYLPVLRREAIDKGADAIARACDLLLPTETKICASELTDLLAELSTLVLECSADDKSTAKELLDSHLCLGELLSKYDYFGRLSCGMLSVEKDGKWGYVDAAGRECIGLDYDWVDEFRLSRAVVMRDDEYGMLDTSGCAVIAPMYETLEIDPNHSFAYASRDGYFGTVDLDGKTVVPFKYRWLGDASCSLLPAQLDDKYGYVDTSGQVVIPFIYDDAYAFRESRALVVEGNQEYYIDPTGSKL